MTQPLQLRLYPSPVGMYLTVYGRLDGTTAGQLGSLVGTALDEMGTGRLSIDLSRTDAIDLAAIRALSGYQAEARSRGIALTVVNAPGPVRNALHACRADDLLTPPAAETAQPAVAGTAGRRRVLRPACVRRPDPAAATRAVGRRHRR
ncbi:STAS domain-containing protein [Catellatospora sp. KI3]|uniref:STAS domain-containing protein n=1 Tax=Catellatospora sp. KI3 TaxID=3041620 RepID=UPI0024830508|nr:STAS domain-containing protein [Catellatospora sp. KI3]MDI1465200.1 STAS domain-containing protein [Catellatospora sp. KI3]